MRTAACVAMTMLLTSCVVIDERMTPLPAATAAIALGPADPGLPRPTFFLADAVADEVLEELVPYEQAELVLAGRRSKDICARYAISYLVQDRPDVILIYPGRPEVTGVTTSFVYTPFTGMFSFATANSETAIVGLAMRASRVRLPFTHDRVTGMVREIEDRLAAPDLLEGDTVTLIGGAAALPPKQWTQWDLYPLLLALRPGDEVSIEWIRPGTGKLQGTVRMMPAKGAHRGVADSIDCRFVPNVVVTEQADGRVTWAMTRHWSDPKWDAHQWVER